jgi:outer membrane immunogenic protein
MEEPAMKKVLLVTALAIGFGAAPAVAADLPARTYSKAPAIVAPFYDWSGFYIGINGGGGWGHSCWDVINDGIAPVVPAAPDGCHNPNGATFGGQIGYRWQVAGWVFGVEAQGNWSDFRGSNDALFFTGFRNQTLIDDFGLFTGQIGYAFDNALLYVKGGGALTDNSYRVFDIPSGFVTDTASGTRWGGVVGVGFEYGIAPNWSVAFEYDHLFMGSHDVNFNLVGGGFDGAEHVSQSVDLFTARFNFRFGGPVVARY